MDYQTTCCTTEHIALSSGFSDDFRASFIKMMQDVYREKQIEIAHKPTVRTIFETIQKGVDEGVEMEIKPETFYEQNPALIQRMKTNVAYFSVAKNRADIVALNNLLVDENGRFRTWSQFRKEAIKILGRSAKYLETEYITAVAGSRMAVRWQKLQAQRHIYPNAKFYVVKDKSTSEICAPLHNVVVPLDHPLLITHFPPNHFRCRTDVLGTNEPATPDNDIKTPDIPEGFRNNIGVTGHLFSENSKYMEALRSTLDDTKIKGFIQEVMEEEDSYIERYKSKKTGGVVRVNLHAHLQDFDENFDLAKRIVDFENAIMDIRPHFEGQKNPEFRIWGIIGDGTHRVGNVKNFVRNSFEKLKPGKQLADLDETFLALDFKNINGLSRKEFQTITTTLTTRLTNFPSVKFVYILYNDKVIKIYNSDAQKGLEYIKKIMAGMKSSAGE